LGVELLFVPRRASAMGRKKRVGLSMGRPHDNRAGYPLLDSMRASGNKTPFIIYAGSSAGKA
jgi:hypothetical protein